MVTAPRWIPDFTAEYLHKTSEFLVKHYQGRISDLPKSIGVNLRNPSI